jgi:threonine/homoserine/homoserine lactone efflux protein
VLPDSQALFLFLLATLALNVTPGPDMLYVTARSLGEGRGAGIISSLGIATGCCVHMLAVAFGVSQALQQAPLLYDAIRYAGAAYLIYLGVRSLISPVTPLDVPQTKPATASRIFVQGVVTNVLNPKVALFFLAFLPQFIDPARGSVIAQLLVLGFLFNTSGTLVNVAVAIAVSHVRRWLTTSRRSQVALQRIPGLVFLGLGARLALAERS